MSISFNKKTGHYDFWYISPKNGKRTKKRILKADGSKPKDLKEAERLIQDFRKEMENLDSIRTRERAIIEIAQTRQLIASREHRLDDLLTKFKTTAKWPESDERRKYTGIVINRFVKWCHAHNLDGIAEITPDHCRQYIAGDLDGLSAGTIRKHQIILQTAFAAVGKVIGLSDNPWSEVKKPVDHAVSRKNYTIEQVEEIAGCFQTWFPDKPYSPEYNDELYMGFLFGLYAGCRLKDACLMRWSNIDLDKQTITYTPAKTAGSSGKQVTLPIIPGREADMIKAALEWSDGSGYVCPHLAEMYKKSNVTVSRIYIHLFEMATGVINACDAGSLKSRSLYGFHSLRHTCASILANAGVDLNVIASLVGHSSTAITQIYTHISAQRQAEEMRRAFGAGAGVKAEIVKVIDGIEDERKLKNILSWLKSI